MNFDVKYSKDMNDDFLDEMIDLDTRVYPESEQGTPSKIKARFHSNRDSYINLYHNDKLIGDVCFFPITEDFADRIYKSHRIFDDDIEPRDIVPFKKGENHTIFIISFVIDKKYQDGEAIKILTNEFIKYLKEKDDNGYFINKILTFTWNNDGFKIAKTLNFHQIERFEDNIKFLECNRIELRLENYKKTYSSDLYIIIPYYLNKVSKLIDNNEKKDQITNEFLNSMNYNSEYECDNEIVKNLKRIYIGNVKLAYFSNDYDENIYGKIDVKIFLTYHEPTNLCMVTLMNLNNDFSPTQIQDQVTTGKLSIFDENDNLVSLDEYLTKKYDIHRISNGKILLSTSNTPKDEIELEYMLASESFNGKKIDYILASNELKKQANTNLSQYDFCEVYAGIDSIIYILKDFSNNSLINMRKETLILYIIEVIMFQNAAILRTNNRIIEELAKDGSVTLSFIENLYTEFGKTVNFWNIDVFNYPAVQNLANSISNAFGTQKNLDDYHKNQEFLEHIVTLRDVQNSNRESKILNTIVLILTIIQVIPLIISFIEWVNEGHIYYYSVTGLSSLILIILVISIKRKRNKDKRRRLGD